MAKEKRITKFNKNHITIEEVHNPEYPHIPSDVVIYQDIISWGRQRSWWDSGTTIEHVERKKSPLGFYYDKVTTEKIYRNDRNKDDIRHWKVVQFKHNDIQYILKFLVSWDENNVQRTEDSLRPWEVAEGDKSLNDNMINSLVTDVANFFNTIENCKISTVYTTGDSYYLGDKPNQYHGGVPRLKDEIYEYLYGHRNGIRFQTDLEKIISHGFDPKYSFRKDKEKK